MEEKMTLQRLILDCKNAKNGDISREDFLKEFSYVDRDKYIPILTKTNIVRSVISHLYSFSNDLFDCSSYMAVFEMTCLFEIYIKYFLDVDVSTDEEDFVSYDVIVSSGLLDILKFRDYDRIIEMVKRAESMDDLRSVRNIADGFDVDKMLQASENIKDALSDKDTISNLSNLINFNDPTYAGYKKIIKDSKEKDMKK